MYYFFLIYKLFSNFVRKIFINKMIKYIATVTILLLSASISSGQTTHGANDGRNTDETVFVRAWKKHMEYDFESAVRMLSGLKDNADSLTAIRIDSLIMLSENGKVLLEYADKPNCLAYKDVPLNEFYLYYSLPEGAWWARVPESLSKGARHEICNVMYVPENANRLFYSAQDNSGSWNIYTIKHINDNIWSAPELLNENLISTGDEIFPVISRDGKSLFFSSNGLSGMGGYDLYVSKWDDETEEWGIPQNLGFPYSTTSDDFLYIENPATGMTLFASNRDSGKDGIRIYATEYNSTPIKESIDSIEEAMELSHVCTAKGDAPGSASPSHDTRLPDDEEGRIYISILEKIQLMNGEIEKLGKTISENRNLYSSLGNEDDKALIAKRISEAELKIMTLNDSMSVISAEVQKAEMNLLKKGINPAIYRNSLEKHSSGKRTEKTFTFTKGNYRPLPAMEVLKPEPEIDFSFRIGKEAELVDISELPDNLIYQVQLFTVARKASLKALKGMAPVFEFKTPTGKYIYRTGIFYSYAEALSNLNKVKKNGFPGAMLSAMYKGKSVTVKEARELEKKLKAGAGWQIAMTMFPNGIPTAILDELKDMTDKDIAKGIENGKSIYYIGPFDSKAEAERIVSRLEELAVEGVSLRQLKK